jgi:tetratricopeptide (TPR) repeat protein
MANLQNLARDAYAKGNFAEPAGESAIAYLKQALAIDPNDDYSRKFLESAVAGGTYQVQQAITKKDFATAHRLAGAMAQLLPGRSDVAGLKEDIASAQRAEEAAHRPQPVALLVSFRVMHMHTDKSPADKGPYCEGTLSVSAGHLKFAAQSATDGQSHNFDFACSDVREVKKNARVASHQGGFHVRTTQANYNFVPADPSSSPVPALASACSK